MAGYADVFERKEVKYRLGAEQVARVQRALAGRMAPDAFGETTVSSLYYDTPERALIERSLDKPLYKEKLRVRWYGEGATGLTPVFLELKKKFKGIVYKRRVRCPLSAARSYLEGALPVEGVLAEARRLDGSDGAAGCTGPLAPATSGCRGGETAAATGRASSDAFAGQAPSDGKSAVTWRNGQVMREIDAFARRTGRLEPSMLIRCARTAFAPLPEAADAQGVRITFDRRISYEDVPSGRRGWALPCDEVIMEVKVPGPFPLWLARLLSSCGCVPSSFSKYGSAYSIVQRELAEAREETRRCA